MVKLLPASFLRSYLSDLLTDQFADGFFDAVIDKGGLDALMEPKLGAKLGCKFLKEVCWLCSWPLVVCFHWIIGCMISLVSYSVWYLKCWVWISFCQVKRVLKIGGKYICLTLAEFHVLGKNHLIRGHSLMILAHWLCYVKGYLLHTRQYIGHVSFYFSKFWGVFYCHLFILFNSFASFFPRTDFYTPSALLGYMHDGNYICSVLFCRFASFWVQTWMENNNSYYTW